ncbi:unnamed protein product [Durusdinium trenchii]|uniref:Uncharacterized protein n=2 Tax=Durusdinium trenchii TaxID=1381693 RepID=A0ABP0MQD4_9DINO
MMATKLASRHRKMQKSKRHDAGQFQQTFVAALVRVEEISAWVAKRVEEHHQQSSDASHRLTSRVEDLEQKYAARVREAKSAMEFLKEPSSGAASDIVVSAWSDDAQRRALHLRQEAEELKRKLQHAEARAGCDEQWLVRQIAAETQRGRQELERRFEETSKELKTEHVQVMEQLRSQREERLNELRRTLDEERLRATAQAEEALADAVKRQELSFQVERENLEAAQERQSTSLNEARQEVELAKGQCQERQRVLDEMSRELQERKRHGQMMSKEADLAHGRKLRQETDSRELRRRKVALERSLGLKASYTHESATEESWGIPVDSWKALKRITYICRYHIYIYVYDFDMI